MKFGTDENLFSLVEVSSQAVQSVCAEGDGWCTQPNKIFVSLTGALVPASAASFHHHIVTRCHKLLLRIFNNALFN